MPGSWPAPEPRAEVLKCPYVLTDKGALLA